MKKEEKIKEAWGDNYSKDVIMEGRRCGFKIITNMEYISIYKGGDWYCEPDTFETIAFMPTTLRQILKNNGWVKIESEEDLPKEVIECRTCFYNGKNYIEGVIKKRSPQELSRLKYINEITHYQPIEKPKPPIY